jgi:dimethylargininase
VQQSTHTALIRGIPTSFANALVQHGRPTLDPAIARRQHDEYRARLSGAGYAIAEVPVDEACPDCVFIEDAAVIIGSIAVITRPGAASRRPETAPVAEALKSYRTVTWIESPGTIDGGDVFTMNSTVYVGLSERTNLEGIAQLRPVVASENLRLQVVKVVDTLHLKSAVLPVDDETVVVTLASVDHSALGGLRILYEDAAERHRFSCLPMLNGHLLATESSPRTNEMLATAGYLVDPIDVSELQAADGGLTCMSIIL